MPRTPRHILFLLCDRMNLLDITGPLGPLLATLAVLPVHDIGVAPFTVEDTVLRLYEEGTC